MGFAFKGKWNTMKLGVPPCMCAQSEISVTGSVAVSCSASHHAAKMATPHHVAANVFS